MIDSRKQTGSALVVIIIVAAVALLGVLGYVLWNNYLAPKDNEAAQQTITTPETDVEETPVPDPDKGFFVLENWGVKFKLPADSGEIRYYKTTFLDDNEAYQLSTKRVEELGGRCAPGAEDGQILLSTIGRTQNKIDEGRLVTTGTRPVNNGESIDGYYYYVGGGQSSCSDEHTDWQVADNLITFDMLNNPIPIE